MRGRLLLALLVVLVTAANCQATTDTTLADPDAVPLRAGPDDVEPPGVMIELLARIPRAVLDEGRSGTFSLGDLNAATEVAGLARPDPADLDSSLEWWVELTGRRSGEDERNGFVIRPTFLPNPSALVFTEEIQSEFGFSPLAVDTYSTFTEAPGFFSVLEGELSLGGDLIDLGAGIFSAGDGEDLITDLEARTSGRPLGRPLRFAERDDLVAMSLLTPLVRGWLDSPTPSIANDPQLAAVANALDQAGSVVAEIVLGDFPSFRSTLDAQVANDVPRGISVPFSVVAIGVTAIEGIPANVIVYAFDTEADAIAARAEIDSGWRTGLLASVNQPISDFYEVVTVDQTGVVAVVTVRATEKGTTATALDMLYRGEPVLSFDPPS